MSLRAFNRRRADFQKYLSTNEPGLNVNRYLRLMALASTEILVVLPLNLVSLVGNLSNGPLRPWISWADVHYNFSRVAYVARFLVEGNKRFFIEFTVGRWAIPISGLLFFLFFGLSREAIKDYNTALWFVLDLFGMKKPAPPAPGSRPRRKLYVFL